MRKYRELYKEIYFIGSYLESKEDAEQLNAFLNSQKEKANWSIWKNRFELVTAEVDGIEWEYYAVWTNFENESEASVYAEMVEKFDFLGKYIKTYMEEITIMTNEFIIKP